MRYIIVHKIFLEEEIEINHCERFRETGCLLREENDLVTFTPFLYHYLWQLCNPVIPFSSTKQWGYCIVRKMQLKSHTYCVSCCIHCLVKVKWRIYGRCAQNKAEFLPARFVNFHMKLVKKVQILSKICGHGQNLTDSYPWLFIILSAVSNFQNSKDHYHYKIGKYCAYL